MTIKVQGETYDSPEELLTAIGELSATLEDMPESSKERADVARHIELLKSAAPAGPDLQTPSVGSAEDEPESDSSLAAVGDLAPAHNDDPEPEPEDDEPVPPGFKLCPVCAGGGLLTEDAPISRQHERCPGCNGFGKVLTGSHVDGHTTIDCTECLGNGYISARSTYAAPTNGHVAAAAPLFPGAIWNEADKQWDAPAGTPPWPDAKWDSLLGAYE